MKLKSILLALVLLCASLPMKAGENDWYLFLSPTYFLNPLQRTTFQGVQLGFEKQLSRSSIAGFTVFAREKALYTKGTFATAEYSLAGYWKPNIAIGKNSDLYLSMGGNVGSGRIGITFGLNLGLEYDITLFNRVKLFIAQDNLLVFRSDERLISGISIGVKIPLSR